MNSLRTWCTGRWPVHFFKKSCGVAAGLMLAAAPFSSVQAAAPAKPVPRAAASSQSVADFYRARGGAPLWLTPKAGDSAQQLYLMLANARLDGLDPDKYRLSALQKALRGASDGDRKAIARADQMLSEAFVAYVRDLRRDPGIDILYVDRDLKPKPPSALGLLLEAAASPSLSGYIREMSWMNPIYVQLRQALLAHNYHSEQDRQRIAVNMERARALPPGRGKFVLVNAAQQRLFMWEDGKPVDSMRVVVGKPKHATPMMSAFIRFASLNPYWFVPPDLAAERIAPNILKRGLGYLDELGYQVLSDWTDSSTVLDPATIDWQAVADGRLEVFIRQLPGPHNAMGRMKFMFPNTAGVYLHDNPDRELFEHAARLYSGGCVRLQDAARLGRWLFGEDLVWEGAGTEEKVPMRAPVPVYITYLTAVPDGSSITYFEDVYSRDAERLAAASNGSLAAR